MTLRSGAAAAEEQGMKRALAAVAAAVLVIVLALLASRSFGFQGLGLFEQDPILVVLVGELRHVELVRKAIAKERIIVDTPAAFATAEERIIAVDAASASVPINQAGWSDREIEIVAIPMDSARNWQRARRSGSRSMSEQERKQAKKIAELMQKPTLNALEAIVLLQHMDQTGQF